MDGPPKKKKMNSCQVKTKRINKINKKLDEKARLFREQLKKDKENEELLFDIIILDGN
jgi:hypothetical protein